MMRIPAKTTNMYKRLRFTRLCASEGVDSLPRRVVSAFTRPRLIILQVHPSQLYKSLWSMSICCRMVTT